MYQSWENVFDLFSTPIVSTTTNRIFTNSDGTQTRIFGTGLTTDPDVFLNTGTITRIDRFDPATGEVLISYTGISVNVATELNPFVTNALYAQQDFFGLVSQMGELTGNNATSTLIEFFDDQGNTLQIIGSGMVQADNTAAFDPSGTVTEMRLLDSNGNIVATSGTVNYSLREVVSGSSGESVTALYGNFIAENATNIFTDSTYSTFDGLLEFTVFSDTGHIFTIEEEELIVDYSYSSTGITGDFNAGTISREGVSDTYNIASTVLGIVGSNYNDNVVLSDTNLIVFGGKEGDDIIQTGNAGALVFGDEGNDTVIVSGAGTSFNEFYGGEGIDTLDYSNAIGAVRINLQQGWTSTGASALDFYLEFENVTGSLYDDVIDGDALGNVLEGNSGDDILRGGGGEDALYGGLGADELNGGNDDDTLSGGGANDLMRGQGGDDTLLGQAGADDMYGGVGDDTLSGGGGDDILRGQGNVDELNGGAGEDLLYGGSGNDTLYGGVGNDILYGQGNNDQMFGDAGNDTLSGAAGSDVLSGGQGDDTLLGGIGADRLHGGAGNDTMNGGGADGARDTFVFGFGDGADRINAFDQAGTDRLELDDALWLGAGTLSAQQVVDQYGSLNVSGTILTLDFGGTDVLEVQSASGIDLSTFGDDVLVF